MFLNPAEDFINAHLELAVEREQDGDAAPARSLFNSQIGDGHFSALGLTGLGQRGGTSPGAPAEKRPDLAAEAEADQGP